MQSVWVSSILDWDLYCHPAATEVGGISSAVEKIKSIDVTVWIKIGLVLSSRCTSLCVIMAECVLGHGQVSCVFLPVCGRILSTQQP